MALYPARAGSRRVHPHLQQRRIGGGRLRQRHALRGRPDREGTGKTQARVRNRGRNRLVLASGRAACSPSTWASRVCAGTRFRWPRNLPIRVQIELEIGPRGAPTLHSPSVVSMGNPHAIFWVEDPAAYDLAKIGPLLEHHPMFPERANITLAATPTRDHVVIRTWERGAGLTKACGSAACAAAVAAARLRRTGRKVTVTLPGGDLAIEWRDGRRSRADDRPGRVRAQGPFRRGVVCQRGGGAMSVEVVTFGCRLNAAESEVIRRNAERAGCSDTVVVNTCAVTAEAVRQARQAIRALRRERPQASDRRHRLRGADRAANVCRHARGRPRARQCGEAQRRGVERGALDDARRRRWSATSWRSKGAAAHLIDTFAGRTRAFVQVQNGCDHRCTFCIIPFGRGNSRSVPMDAVVEDVRRLVANDYREVVLTGVDITSYGADLPGAPKLGALVKQILKHVPELKRLRLSSINSVEADARSARCARRRRTADAASASVVAGGRRSHSQAHEAAALARRRDRVLRAGAPLASRRGVRRRHDRRLSDRDRSDVRRTRSISSTSAA